MSGAFMLKPFTSGPHTLSKICLTDTVGLFPVDHAARLTTFEPPVDILEGDELWTDGDGVFWLMRDGQRLDLVGVTAPVHRREWLNKLTAAAGAE